MLEIIEEQYGIDDRRSWGKGGWDGEPDLLKLVDDTRVYLIRRGPLGALCGYFGVFEPDPLFGKDYDDFGYPELNVEPTFSGKWHQLSEITWWFGWDHAHFMDLIPALGIYDRGGDIYKDIRYVIREMEEINKQLKTRTW